MRLPLVMLAATGALAISVPAAFDATVAHAQATTVPEGTTPPTANDALRMKAESRTTTNPTEQNYTNPHTAAEQPGTNIPGRPPAMKDTDAHSTALPREQSATPHHIVVPRHHPVKQPG